LKLAVKITKQIEFWCLGYVCSYLLWCIPPFETLIESSLYPVCCTVSNTQYQGVVRTNKLSQWYLCQS